MSKELLEGVKLVEKEKGIEAETLLSAIEDALLAAYKKMPDARHPCGSTSTASPATTPSGRSAEDAWDAYLDEHPHHA